MPFAKSKSMSRFTSRSISSRANNYNNESGNGSIWIIAVVLIILILIAIIFGSMYKKYEKFTNASKDYTLLYFCMSKCGYCRSFEEEVWNNFSKKVNANPTEYKFDTIKYDITDNGIGEEKGNKYNIQSTPTIYLINNMNGEFIDFKGNRTEKDLLEFVNKNIK